MQAIRSDLKKLLWHGAVHIWVPTFAGTTAEVKARTLNQQIAEVAPFKVFALNQLDLPVTLPPLQLFLSADCLVRAIIGFDINEAVNAVGFDKRGAVAIAVLREALLEAIGHPDIQGPVTSARKNVDVVHALVLYQHVVPAKAGTHTPCPLVAQDGRHLP